MSELRPEIVNRRARRGLAHTAVPREVLNRLAEAATLAPSCFNNQPWRLVFVTEPDERGVVHRALAGGNYWAERAPAYVVVVTHPDLDCRLDEDRDYALFDTGLAVENLVLQATHEGLIAHPIAGFHAAQLKQGLGIPPEYVAITVVVLGYPGDSSDLTERHRALEAAPRSRVPISEVVWFNRWEGPPDESAVSNRTGVLQGRRG